MPRLNLDPITKCSHNWDVPTGRQCPDCLWEQSCESNMPRQVALPMAQEAIREAALILNDPALQRQVLRIVQYDNNWKALRTARELRLKQLGYTK